MEDAFDPMPFITTFWVTSDGTESPALHVSPVDEHPRKKRAHRKSRLGCVACKRRRVKVRMTLCKRRGLYVVFTKEI